MTAGIGAGVADGTGEATLLTETVDSARGGDW